MIKGGSWNVGAHLSSANQRERRHQGLTPGRGFRVGLVFARRILLVATGRIGKIELSALAKELMRIVIDDFANQRLRVTTTTHFDNQIRNRGRLRRPPVTRRINT